MNIFKKSIFALLIITLSVVGCKKEQSTIIDEISVSNHNPKSSIINNRLVFNTVEEYETFISDMNLMTEDEMLDKAHSDSFTSMYESYEIANDLPNMPVDDIILALLINPSGIIQIEDYIFRIDINNSSVLVYQMGTIEHINSEKITDLTLGVKSAGINQYSTSDDLLDLLTDEFEPTEGGCPQEKLGFYYWYTSGGKVMYKTVYQKAGIYFSLQAKIKKDHYGGAEYLSISTYDSPSTGGANFWKHKKRCDTFFKSDDGYGREYNIRPYSGTRGLTNYLFSTSFYCSDNNTTHSQVLVLDCGNIQKKCN